MDAPPYGGRNEDIMENQLNLYNTLTKKVDYQMIYKDIKGDCFDWLYVDFPLLKSIAETCGLHGELVAEGEHYDYLARIF